VWFVSFCLSFGNQLQLGSWTPWETLCDWFSPLARIRSPYRFAYFTQIAMLILAALAIAPLGILLRRSLRRALMRVPTMTGNPRRRARIATLGSKFAMACLLGALALEIPPPTTFLAHLPVSEKQYPWVQFIAEHTGPNDQLLCLPVAATLSEFDCEVASRWMIFGTLHGRPILNGYSGYFPERWQQMRARLHQQPLKQSLLEDVHELGTDWIIVRKRDYPWSLSESKKLQLAFEDASIQVFKVP
jgi:hypothetical protein